MLELSSTTEAIALRLAKAQDVSVDRAVRQALETCELRLVSPEKDVSPLAVTARLARIDAIVKEIAALPILDARSVKEIVDDLNAL